MRKLKIKKVERDQDGLIKNVDYSLNEDGLIDWRKMVKPEHLVSNRQKTSNTDVSSLDDKDLLILLGGIKELAQIRGYTSVSYDVHSPSSDYVVATCTIDWIANYETEGHAVSFSAIGDASPNNTQSFAKHFLGPIAENRSFVRCVRNFLKINIVGSDELGNAKLIDNSPPQENLTDPKSILSSLMAEKGVSFENLKGRLIKESYEGAEDLASIDALPKIKVFELIQRLKKARKKAK